MLKNREEVLQNDKQTRLDRFKMTFNGKFQNLNSIVFLLLNVIYLFLLLRVWLTKGTTI